MSTANSWRYICKFTDVGLGDIAKVGGKNASLGQMMQNMTKHNILVPDGFVITADAYTQLITESHIKAKLEKLLQNIDKNDVDKLSKVAKQARELVVQAGLPDSLSQEICQAYEVMNKQYGGQTAVAVRSSATAEDLPEASFAGQQESFLNVSGESSLLDACLKCFASLFTDRAIAYRIDNGFDHMSVRLSIGVQKMIRSDLAASGVIFTLDPESGFTDVVLITSAFGLGENIVKGRVEPDEFLVFKPTLNQGYEAVMRHKTGSKEWKLIYSQASESKPLEEATVNIETSALERRSFSLTDPEIITLAKWACLIEEQYSNYHGHRVPMDIEWAKDGLDGQLYIVQARPETIHRAQKATTYKTYILDQSGPKLLTGQAVGQAIASGPAKLISSVEDLNLFQDGDILVADLTDPDWEPIMKRASAIITNRGGRTCHAAIVSRELGIPCIVGTVSATKALTTGNPITVSCAEGEIGSVYQGHLAFHEQVIGVNEIPAIKTKIMLNLANPSQAFSLANLPVAGVGLAREEFIIANEVRVHPLALTRYDALTDPTVKTTIDELTAGFAPRENYFVTKLAEGIALIASAFYPRPVIVRLSDFKTNEYANLIGGRQFEEREENPMLGFRGASRYYHEKYQDGFALECQALIKAREEFGLLNIKVMVPFCRTPEEGKRVIAEMTKNGLVQNQDGLEVYVMCEVPANVILAKEFLAVFDGFSIGSNDLTQLTLGLDRDSALLAPLFDERNPAVKNAIAHVIAQAKKAGKPIGICGQAPSDYPEFAQFLVEHGIDSISLSSDAVFPTIFKLAQVENKIQL
jgi:pyruvate,water dikinase